MTREDAVKAHRALREIEEFEQFMEDIMSVIADYSKTCDISDIGREMVRMMNHDLAKRENVLKDM